MKKVENQLAFFSPWICGKDCNIPEASWSDSHISLSLSISLSLCAFEIIRQQLILKHQSI